MNASSQLDVAIEIARETGEIALSYFNAHRMATRAKGSRDVVTEADLAAERCAIERLTAAFPGDGIVAEEGGRVAAAGERRWFLDPLDGTMNFSRGIPIWCVSLALFEKGRPVLGVVHDPIRGETFHAEVGHGSRCNGQAVRASDVEHLRSAVVHLTIDFNDQSRLEGLEDLLTLAPHVLRTRNIGSAALALAYTAAGRFDAMVHRFAHTWDYAAGVLLVQEAGGCVTDINGGPFAEKTTSVIAAAGRAIHRQLLDLIQRPTDATVQ